MTGEKIPSRFNHGIPRSAHEAVERPGGLVSGVVQSARSTVNVQGVIYADLVDIGSEHSLPPSLGTLSPHHTPRRHSAFLPEHCLS
jgi:hypothetical protein